MPTPAPTPTPAPALTSAYSSPAPAPAPAPKETAVFAKSTPSGLVPASSFQGKPDAFLNFGNGGYADADLLINGSIKPWYESPSVVKAFGGTPSVQQQRQFESQVLDQVQKIYAQNGLSPKLTLDPNASADHTMSVVSGASFVGNSNAIGITNVGYNGFNFIDKLNYAKSPEELATALASNVAHELMHAFGVGAHHDQSGKYLDSASASWSLLTDPNASFSPKAVADLLGDKPAFNPDAARSLSAQVLTDAQGECLCAAHMLAAQLIAPAPVPEPTTVAVWTIGLISVLGARSISRRKSIAA
ncbi:MAG: hypothetical protein AB7I30_08110 [Isosphaeraceae bacterium]